MACLLQNVYHMFSEWLIYISFHWNYHSFTIIIALEVDRDRDFYSHILLQCILSWILFFFWFTTILLIERRSTTKMLKPFKRQFSGAAALILIICSAVFILCFYSVPLISNDDDDRSVSKSIDRKENEFLNLTNFRYTIQPTDAICDSSFAELDGKLNGIKRKGLNGIILNIRFN